MQGAQRAVVAVLGTGLVDPTGPVIRVDDPGVTRGDGCFEGCRLRDGVIDKLDAHLARLTRSAAALEIPFDRPAWEALIAEAAAAWTAPGEAAMKVLLTRGAPGEGPSGFVAIGPLPADYPRQRRDGLKVVTLSRGFPSDAFADASWLLGGVKTLSYAVNMAAQREASRRGADDAVLISSDAVVLESPTGSVAWWDGSTLQTTPTGDTGILAGTTQRLLFERAATAGWATAETTASVADLHAADVVWLIGSVRGPVDVVELDGVARSRVPDVDAEVRRLAGFSG
ncbi:MAG TPA: aminotransferase class IV [Sporichthyaceae bacterium]|nr:aminotransferase class IV [Sporichthyaceae bacterium]